MLGKVKNMKLRYKIGVGVATGAAIVAGGGAAFAYWTTSGAGSGSAATGSAGASDIAISDNSSSLTPLAPGVAPQEVTVTYSNNNTSNPEALSSATVSLSVTPTGTNVCAASNYEINGTSYAGAVTIFSGSVQEITHGTPYVESDAYTIGFDDSQSVNQSGCEGATVTLTYASS